MDAERKWDYEAVEEGGCKVWRFRFETTDRVIVDFNLNLNVCYVLVDNEPKIKHEVETIDDLDNLLLNCQENSKCHLPTNA